MGAVRERVARFNSSVASFGGEKFWPRMAIAGIVLLVIYLLANNNMLVRKMQRDNKASNAKIESLIAAIRGLEDQVRTLCDAQDPPDPNCFPVTGASPGATGSPGTNGQSGTGGTDGTPGQNGTGTNGRGGGTSSPAPSPRPTGGKPSPRPSPTTKPSPTPSPRASIVLPCVAGICPPPIIIPTLSPLLRGGNRGVLPDSGQPSLSLAQTWADLGGVSVVSTSSDCDLWCLLWPF